MFQIYLISLKNFCRIHTCSELNSKSAKVLKKILKAPKKRKFHFNPETPILPSTTNMFGTNSFETKVTGNPRRSLVLNKLFMRYITDLMGTGEYSSEIVGYGIEVNKIQITPDYRILKVYWTAKTSEDKEIMENVLKKNAGALRHELSQLRVIGQVPNIVFVKDKAYSQIVEVESRLTRADFGEDYTETSIAEDLKSEREIWTSLDCNVKKKLEKLEAETSENLSEDVSDIPSMPQNVLGLNHADILNRIKKGMKAAQAQHRKNVSNEKESSEWSQFKMLQPINLEPFQFASRKDQRAAFKDFLQKRQMLKMKRNKNDKNWSPDAEYVKEELKERLLKSLEDSKTDMLEDYYFTEDFEEDDR